MRDGPGLHADQHRMLEHAPDIAAAIGRDHENARRPHQQLREVVGPSGRGPHVDPAGRAILAEAVPSQNERGKRDYLSQPLIGPLAEAPDHRGTRSTQRDEDMRPEEDDKSEHENRQPHGPSLARNPCRRLRGCPAGAVEAMARREARSSASRLRLHRPRRWAPVNSALAMTAAQVITPLPARDRLRTMSTDEHKGERENSMNRRFALALSGLLFAVVPAAAQDWPTKTVRIIVPFGPGSTPDMVGRLIADHMQQQLGQPFVIENRPGASANTGTEMVAKADPDGYTIGVSLGGPLAINTLLFAKLPYDPAKDLALITMLTTQPSALVVHASLGVDSVAELVDLLRGTPANTTT